MEKKFWQGTLKLCEWKGNEKDNNKRNNNNDDDDNNNNIEHSWSLNFHKSYNLTLELKQVTIQFMYFQIYNNLFLKL